MPHWRRVWKMNSYSSAFFSGSFQKTLMNQISGVCSTNSSFYLMVKRIGMLAFQISREKSKEKKGSFLDQHCRSYKFVWLPLNFLWFELLQFPAIPAFCISRVVQPVSTIPAFTFMKNSYNFSGPWGYVTTLKNIFLLEGSYDLHNFLQISDFWASQSS